MTVNDYCEKRQRSDVTLKLIEKLKRFDDTDDYIFGVLSQSPYDEDRQLIIDYIDKGKDVSYENVLLFSLEIGLQRDKQLNR